ncbi:peptidase S9 [Portibacter lacus]|uniref:Peptidase S9 n=2 Tax=Portibacter lacus TaxID=1099794 RepID=A0AA37SQZ6_9BACT|nr:peptidase S9 [Portibacter lacus]
MNGQKAITLEDLWSSGEYYEANIPGFNFLKDGEHYTRLESNKINKYDFSSGEFVETIFENDERLSGYEFSVSENLIIYKVNVESIYRRSSKADYYIYNRKTKQISRVHPESKIGYATVSPDETHVAYTLDNNLFVKKIGSKTAIQITQDGKWNEIINGSADWVYEEEFSMSQAFDWSPDSKKIGFLKFDEKEVKEFTIQKDVADLYPTYETFKYPKVGEKNAFVSAHIYNIDLKKTTKVQVGDEGEYYLPRFKWLPSSEQMIVFKINRLQNHLELLAADPQTGKASVLLAEKNKYYIRIHDDLTFLKNGKEFIWSSEKNGYSQLFIYDLKGKEKVNLTPGEYDVSRFYGVDEHRKEVYYQAAKKNPLESEVYAVSLDGKKSRLIAGEKGTSSVQFSSNFDHYVLRHSTINSPTTIRIFNQAGEKVRTLEENEALVQKMKRTGVVNVEFFNFKTSEDVSLNGWIIKPANFNPKKKYPVFMTLYGGPGSQTVTDSWKGQNYWWFQLLAQQGYVVASVDNRGTGARGEEFRKMTYLQLGKYETIDQIEAAKYLGSLDYTDAKRIGIFGWSYGGYMSTSCLLKGNDVFKAAIAVAPVTSWRWYDSVYTERYMRTEKDNAKGYLDNSPVYFADQLKGKYLIIHGIADDNVHFQQSSEMVNALIRANKQFESFYYPSRNHGIYGDNARLHLYTMMTNFLYNNL